MRLLRKKDMFFMYKEFEKKKGWKALHLQGLLGGYAKEKKI